MKNIINKLTLIAFSVLGLFFIAAIFVIGVVAFWYILLIGFIILGIRRIQSFFKGRVGPQVPPANKPHHREQPEHKGRIIEHED